MTTEALEQTKTLEEEQLDFCENLSMQIQTMINELVGKNLKDADRLNISLLDLTCILGSSIASILYEQLREEDQPSGLTENQRIILDNCNRVFQRGWADKLALIANPDEFQKIDVSPIVH